MSEEKDKVPEEPTDLPAGRSVEPSADNMIDRLNAAVDRQEAANKVTADLIRRQEEVKVQQTLGGQASAGGAPALSDDEKKDAAARKFLEGTGYEDELFPDKKV